MPGKMNYQTINFIEKKIKGISYFNDKQSVNHKENILCSVYKCMHCIFSFLNNDISSMCHYMALLQSSRHLRH